MKGSVETRMSKILAEKYGSDSAKAKTGDGKDTEENARPNKITMVGSVSTDKVTLLTKEFDALFNYVEPIVGVGETDKEHRSDNADSKMKMPEVVGSGLEENPNSRSGIV